MFGGIGRGLARLAGNAAGFAGNALRATTKLGSTPSVGDTVGRKIATAYNTATVSGVTRAAGQFFACAETLAARTAAPFERAAGTAYTYMPLPARTLSGYVCDALRPVVHNLAEEGSKLVDTFHVSYTKALQARQVPGQVLSELEKIFAEVITGSPKAQTQSAASVILEAGSGAQAALKQGESYIKRLLDAAIADASPRVGARYVAGVDTLKTTAADIVKWALTKAAEWEPGFLGKNNRLLIEQIADVMGELAKKLIGGSIGAGSMAYSKAKELASPPSDSAPSLPVRMPPEVAHMLRGELVQAFRDDPEVLGKLLTHLTALVETQRGALPSPNAVLGHLEMPPFPADTSHANLTDWSSINGASIIMNSELERLDARTTTLLTNQVAQVALGTGGGSNPSTTNSNGNAGQTGQQEQEEQEGKEPKERGVVRQNVTEFGPTEPQPPAEQQPPGQIE